MQIYLDKRAVRQIRLSVTDAIDEGDTDTLREDLIDAFSEEDIEEIERRIDSGDFFELVTEVLDEWSAEDAEELFELLETQLSDAGLDLKLARVGDDDDEDEDDDDVDDDELDLDDEDEFD